MNYVPRITLASITNVQTCKPVAYELNQQDTVHRLMFVTLDISTDKTGEGVLESLRIRILSLFPKKELLRVKSW